MTKLYRIVKYAFQNLGRNLWLTVMTIVVLTVMLLSVNVLISLNVIANSVTASLEERVDVAVYLAPDATDDEVRSVREYLVGLPQSASVQTVLPDEALAEFRLRHQDDAAVLAALDEVGENPLGTTLIVRARALDQYPAILAALDHPAYRTFITEKNYEDYGTLVARIQGVKDKIQTFGITLLSVFAVIALVITVNAVRVAIFTHRDEIGIMKLVGASGMFIRGPYLVESFLLSMIALALSAAAIGAAIYAGSPYLSQFLGTDPGLLRFFGANALVIVAAELGALAVLTTIASSYAVGRYMKV